MKKDPSPSNPQTIAWTASVVLHVAIITFIAFYAYFWGFTIDGDVRITSSSQSVPQNIQRLVEPDAKDKSFLGDTDRAMAQRVATHEGVRSVLTQASDRAAHMSAQDQMHTLESNTSKLNQIKPKDMDQVLGHIETSMGIMPPQTQPASSRPDTPFDPNSSRPTAIIPAIGPKKEPGYLWTLTDANGRTNTFYVPTSNMSADDLRMAGLFEKARNSPNFGRALDTAIKLAVKRADEKAPPATRPAKQ